MVSSRIEVAVPSDGHIKILGALRKRARIILGLRVLVAALVVSAIADNALSHGDDWAKFDHRQFTCTAAGDSDVIGIGGGEWVHLLGVAGCTAHWDGMAKSRLSGYVGDPLVLKLEPTQTRDARGRLLAWVFLSSQQTLNAEMVRGGFLLADRPDPSTLLTSVESAEREARQKNRGLWGEVDNWEMPEWRREWSSRQRELRDKLQRLAAGQ
jgi:hypothetical protein